MAAAAATRSEVLALFRSLLRTAKQFSDYNIREYTRRRAAVPSGPPAPLASAQSLVVPGLGAAAGPAMELMAVPKKKVSKYKKGLRNGPKALKPVPVIVRCRCCGRVKLPHFYCCSGERGNPSESSS